MIANMTIANKTNTPIWSKGAIALIIDFKTTCKPRDDDDVVVSRNMKRKYIRICFR